MKEGHWKPLNDMAVAGALFDLNYDAHQVNTNNRGIIMDKQVEYAQIEKTKAILDAQCEHFEKQW